MANNSFTPLHFAVAKGHVSLVRALLDAGADTDALANNSVTPLALAVRALAVVSGHDEVVRTLRNDGAT